jgi:hypothetical protein
MIGWLLTSAALAGSCDPNEAVVRGLQAWLAGDPALTRAALDEAVTAFGCSPISEPQTLARYLILDGAVRSARGEREESLGSFAAARRVAPDVWLQDLGPELHAAWSSAVDPVGRGTIVVEPHPGPGLIWIDGVPSSAPEVPAGLHLVQVGQPGGPDAKFATVVWVDPDVSLLVEVVEAPPPPAPEPQPVMPLPQPEPPPKPAVRPELQLLTGASTSYGEGSSDGELREPEVKVAVPLELGVGVASEVGFVRLQLGGAMLVGGRYLALTEGGDPIARTTRLDVGGAAGLGDELRFGLAGGVQWPSRVAGRVLLGWSPTPHLMGELRIGANVTTDPGAEPAGELLIGVCL